MSQFRKVRSETIPSIEGIRNREFDKRKINSQKVEIAVNAKILEVKIGRDVKTRLIKIVEFEELRWPYFLALPAMWILTLYVMAKKSVYKLLGKDGPKINTFWFDGLGLSCRKAKEGAASWSALDEIYNYQFGQRNGLGGFVDDFWEGMFNCQAVRNRLKLVKQQIERAILRFSNHEEIRLLSLATGSAQGVIEVMAELKERGIRVRALLLDIDQTALDYAKQLARRHDVSDQIEMVKASVAQVSRVSKSFQPHIIEMVGLLDYIPRDKAIRLVRKILESLADKGIFLTCNIAPNLEMRFLRWVVNWPMIYRTPVELAEIVSEAGFSQCRLVYEPLEIHGLMIAQKNGA